jgi:hypothetical protein
MRLPSDRGTSVRLRIPRNALTVPLPLRARTAFCRVGESVRRLTRLSASQTITAMSSRLTDGPIPVVARLVVIAAARPPGVAEAGAASGARTPLTHKRLVAREVPGPLGLVETTLGQTVPLPRPYLHGYDVAPRQPAERVSRVFAANRRYGRRSVVFFVNAQVVPREGSPAVSDATPRAQLPAVCPVLG